MTFLRRETIGDATLYLGDCREVLPTLTGLQAIVADGPYGQRYKPSGRRLRAHMPQPDGSKKPVRSKLHKRIIGDDVEFDPAFLLELAPHVLLWGAHKFAHRLPPGFWLVWDKVPNGKVRLQGDGEAAWLNDPSRPMRIFRLLWDGLCVGSGARHEVTNGQQRLHPTQKPELLMRWCIEQLPADVERICDPFMGSGSTGVAALQLGRSFIGIELDPDYFDIACRRIEQASRQLQLFPGTAA